jgi:hypothetical protein
MRGDVVIDDRVFVTLTQDEGGFPPWDEEEIWATPLGDGLFRLDAPPTFVWGVSCDDVVSVVARGDRWYIDVCEKSGGHSTMRVILFDDAAHDRIIETARRHGSEAHHTRIQSLFAIDVPPEAPYEELRLALLDGFDEGVWDYDEGNIAVGHRVPDDGTYRSKGNPSSG